MSKLSEYKHFWCLRNVHVCLDTLVVYRAANLDVNVRTYS